MHSTSAVKRDLEAAELVLEEAVVEARVVRDEEVALRAARAPRAASCEKRGRVAHHLVGDAGERPGCPRESSARD